MEVDLTENLKHAVMLKDIAAARSAILTEIRNDRTREEPRALRLADLVSKELPGFYELDNGFCSSLSDLDISDELWTKARSAMMLNFSRERLCFIEEIVRALCSKKTNVLPLEEKPSDASQKAKSGTRIFFCACLVVGVVTTCLVLAILRSKKHSPSPVGTIVKSRPTERLNECLCPTNHPTVDSTNTTYRINNGKDNR